MDAFVNPISFGDISTEVRDAFVVALESLATTGTSLVSARRFEYPPQEGDSGVDISAKVSVSGQDVTIGDVWASGETTKPKGPKRIQVVARNNDDSAREESNIFINIL